jgi:hypothetical protein
MSPVDFITLFYLVLLFLVIGCIWPYLAVVKHMNKLIELVDVLVLFIFIFSHHVTGQLCP